MILAAGLISGCGASAAKRARYAQSEGLLAADIEWHDFEAARLLLEQGPVQPPTLGWRDQKYGTYLNFCLNKALTWQAPPSLIKLLLDHGAAPTPQPIEYLKELTSDSFDGQNVSEAYGGDPAEPFQLLLDAGAGRGPGAAAYKKTWATYYLPWAASHGARRTVQSFVDDGADPNPYLGAVPYQFAGKVVRPVALALAFGHQDVAELLAERGGAPTDDERALAADIGQLCNQDDGYKVGYLLGAASVLNPPALPPVTDFCMFYGADYFKGYMIGNDQGMRDSLYGSSWMNSSGVLSAILNAVPIMMGRFNDASSLIDRIGKNGTFINKAAKLADRASTYAQKAQDIAHAVKGAQGAQDAGCPCAADRPYFQGGSCFSSYETACAGVTGPCTVSKCGR